MSLNTPFGSKSSMQPSNNEYEQEGGLCQKCVELDVPNFFSTSRPVSEKDDPRERWGSFTERDYLDIKNTAHCPLCQLICKAIPISRRTQRPKDNDRIYIYRMLFGEYEREHISPNQTQLPQWKLHRTNRLLVSTIPQLLDNVRREFARFGDDFKTLMDLDDDSEGYITLLCDQEKDKENSFLHGRAVSPQFDLNLANLWIDICAAAHGDICSLPSSSEKAQRPLRLINIKNRRVEHAPATCTYATLTYRWPDKSFKLGAGTQDRLTALGGLADDQEDIPLSIRDAMIVCGELSMPYLWVDALCIMQDDKSELESQMKAFPDIYEGCHLTIAAASEQAGLPGIRSLSRTAQQTADYSNLTLAVARLDCDSAMENEPLGARIWTFQEFLKSRRLLIFTDSQVFFKCNAALWCEDTEQEDPVILGNIRNITVPKSNALSWKELPHGEANFFNYYVTKLENYAARQGSNENDILRAFSSFARDAGKLLGTEFFYGMPKKYLPWALCFDASWCIPRKGNYPSWSWCSWKSLYPIEYDDEEHLKTFVSSSRFYCVDIHSDSTKEIVHIKTEFSFRCSPSYIITLPIGLTDSELRYLLIFDARRAHVQLDGEQDRDEEYAVRIPKVLTSGDAKREKPMGTVHMDKRLRRKFGGGLFECVEVGIQYMYSHERKDLKVKLLLIKTDTRGVSRRIGLLETTLGDWSQALPVKDMVYMI